MHHLVNNSKFDVEVLRYCWLAHMQPNCQQDEVFLAAKQVIL